MASLKQIKDICHGHLCTYILIYNLFYLRVQCILKVLQNILKPNNFDVLHNVIFFKISIMIMLLISNGTETCQNCFFLIYFVTPLLNDINCSLKCL